MRGVLVVGAVTLIFAGAGILVLDQSAGPQESDLTADPRDTSAVELRTLSLTQEITGTLAYEGEGVIFNGLAGIYTQLPEPGSAIARGDIIAKVDNSRASVSMYGELPAWRRLARGTRGDDVKQLETNLKELGYAPDGFEPDDRFNAATERMVKRWQRDIGVQRSGSIELGEIVFLPGPVRVREVPPVIGATALPGELLAVTSSMSLAVSAQVSASQSTSLAEGELVDIELPDGTTRRARLARLGPAERTGEGMGLAVTLVFEFTERASVDFPEGALATVQFTLERREDVLSVPVDALLALPEGGYGVEVVAPDNTVRVTPVNLGMHADGHVEVRGELRAGDEVVVAR